MSYSRVHIESIGFELAPVVVTTHELESRLSPLYEKLRISHGQLEALTGIAERRWWEKGYPISEGASAAARKALAKSNVEARDIQTLVYTGVCRENFEPATACAVASALGVSSDAYIYDISNACLGVLNGIIDVANRIELGQIKAGLVVSCESARDINEIAIRRMLEDQSMPMFTQSLATLTGGSGAVAVLLTDKTWSAEKRRRLLSATARAAPQYHRLCRWGLSLAPEGVSQFMTTDAVAVLKHGVELGIKTWQTFLSTLGWAREQVDKVICHQVGSGHRDAVLRELGIALNKDFSTFSHLGNMGTVSLPLTAAMAEQRQFLKPGDRVGFLGIGSGLNCLMLGWEW